MAKNIEMTTLTSSGSYETLYPKTLSSQVVNEDGSNPFTVSGTHQIGDIYITGREVDDKWLLCDGTAINPILYPDLMENVNVNPYTTEAYSEKIAFLTKYNFQSLVSFTISTNKFYYTRVKHGYICTMGDSNYNNMKLGYADDDGSFYLIDNFVSKEVYDEMDGYYSPTLDWYRILSAIYVDGDNYYGCFIGHSSYSDSSETGLFCRINLTEKTAYVIGITEYGQLWIKTYNGCYFQRDVATNQIYFTSFYSYSNRNRIYIFKITDSSCELIKNFQMLSASTAYKCEGCVLYNGKFFCGIYDSTSTNNYVAYGNITDTTHTVQTIQSLHSGLAKYGASTIFRSGSYAFNICSTTEYYALDMNTGTYTWGTNPAGFKSNDNIAVYSEDSDYVFLAHNAYNTGTGSSSNSRAIIGVKTNGATITELFELGGWGYGDDQLAVLNGNLGSLVFKYVAGDGTICTFAQSFTLPEIDYGEVVKGYIKVKN